MHQYAHFLACLCETHLSGTYGLSLFCYPSFKQSDVEKKLSTYSIPYKGEGKSKKPACDGDKILVFPLAFDFEKKSRMNKKVVLRFLQKGISRNHKALIVRLDSKSVPTVKFFNEQQNLLCEVLILKTQQAPGGSVTGDTAQGKKRPACGASEEILAKNPRTQPNKRKSSKEDMGKDASAPTVNNKKGKASEPKNSQKKVSKKTTAKKQIARASNKTSKKEKNKKVSKKTTTKMQTARASNETSKKERNKKGASQKTPNKKPRTQPSKRKNRKEDNRKGSVEEMQQESQGKRHSAGKRVAATCSTEAEAAKKSKFDPTGEPGTSEVFSTSETRKFVVKDGKPEDIDLSDIAEEITQRWRKLGRVLGVPEKTLRSIFVDHKDDNYEMAFQVLWHWKENLKDGKISCYQILFDALTKIGRGDLAKDYCLKVSERGKVTSP